MWSLRAGPILTAVFIATLAVRVHAEQDRDTLFGDWIDAVDAHRPGESDLPAAAIAGWTKNQLLTILNHPALGRSPGAIRRGAILHFDIAILSEARATGNLFPFYDRKGPGPPPQPFLVMDGTGLSRGISPTHLEFARALITKLSPEGRASFGAGWYAATGALLAVRRNFSDLAYHLKIARLAVPATAELLLAAGCLHEMFAGSMAQAVQKTSPRLEVGDRDDNLRQAEQYFSRALEHNPHFVEARLRRGRVLGQLNKHAEAVSDLHRARELTADPYQNYYIRLFLGREEERLGRLDDARQHFEAAAALFPRAQSPRLSLSRLAAHQGEMSGARQALDDGLRTEPGDYADDPWWIYDLGPGRYAAAMMKELYAVAVREKS
jgi:Tetratricopeptide repeat